MLRMGNPRRKQKQRDLPTARVVDRLSLYSKDCRELLQQALDILPEEQVFPHHVSTTQTNKSRFADSSSSEEEDDTAYKTGEGNEEEEDSSGRDSDENDDQPDKTETLDQNKQESPVVDDSKAKHQTTKKNPLKNKKVDDRQREASVRKHVDLLMCHALSLPSDYASSPTSSLAHATVPADLHISSSLLSKSTRLEGNDRAMAQSFLDLANHLQGVAPGAAEPQHQAKSILVLSLRSGRFATALFQEGHCTHHRTAQRYTVRKGQGKAQSVQDGQKGKPKSMGSQLRRAGEVQLKEDLRQTLQDWHSLLQPDRCALILISCPKTMLSTLYECMDPIVPRTDAVDNRIRRVPLDVGRPTLENVLLIHDVLTCVTVRKRLTTSTTNTTTSTSVHQQSPVSAQQQQQEQQQQDDERSTRTTEEPAAKVIIPLTDWHTAAKNGDLELIRKLLSRNDDHEEETQTDNDKTDIINLGAGKDLMTPLHYAANCTATDNGPSGGVDPTVAADMVMALLVEGQADPSRVDARNRPPYFLAVHEKVRNAFRMARSSLGEDYCDWDGGARVGPPLSLSDVQERKDKEADKKKRKKARQKEKRAKERAEQQEQAKLEEQQKQEQAAQVEAKRIRDGLQPKVVSGANVCDYCQTVVKGRQRSQMFRRLEYSYCRTDCVQKHKRELMACAALARFQPS